MKRKAKIIGLVVVGVLILAGCSVHSTAPDQAGLHYTGGAFSSTKYQDCITPSNRVTNGPGDNYYDYPNGQRSFDFAGGNNAELNPITVVSKDNVELKITGGLTFALDTSCNPIDIGGHHYKGGMLQAFHERLGIKYKAYMNGDQTSDGWVNLLDFYLGKPLTNALQNAAQKYTWLALYNDPQTRLAFENEVKTVLPDSVKAQTGGQDYFVNFNLIVQKPEPPQALVDGLASVQQAILRNKTIAQQNVTVLTELQQIRELTKALGPYGYILYKALQDCESGKTGGCPQFLPVPQGSNFTLPVGK